MKSRGHNYFRFLPIIGILIFVMLYLVAASLYPGGSSAFPEKDGFDWINSYWCNLTESYAINGKVNTARPYALSGVVILCISLTHFFFLFPRYFELKSPLGHNSCVLRSACMYFCPFNSHRTSRYYGNNGFSIWFIYSDCPFFWAAKIRVVSFYLDRCCLSHSRCRERICLFFKELRRITSIDSENYIRYCFALVFVFEFYISTQFRVKQGGSWFNRLGVIFHRVSHSDLNSHFT